MYSLFDITQFSDVSSITITVSYAIINRRLSWQDKPVNIGTVPIPAAAGPPFSFALPKRKQQPRFVFVVAGCKSLNFSRCFPIWILRGGDSPESEDRRDMGWTRCEQQECQQDMKSHGSARKHATNVSRTRRLYRNRTAFLRRLSGAQSLVVAVANRQNRRDRRGSAASLATFLLLYLVRPRGSEALAQPDQDEIQDETPQLQVPVTTYSVAVEPRDKAADAVARH